ncbi:MAG: DNA topoisomerase IV, partial [Campylobacterota bacterium]|nr:DNA topoisomerase IV [Campylobacterota bacterium]
MKILLLNDNPVVNKLVTLSAQKTSDSLDIVTNIDEIEESAYDLLVVDDTLYSEELVESLNKKVTYNKSLYICSRGSDSIDSFDSTLKKPFLPTDLVELFSVIGKETQELETPDTSFMEDDTDIDDGISLEDPGFDEIDD